MATPVQRGAWVIMYLVLADGRVLIPRFSEGLDARASVNMKLLRRLEHVENTSWPSESTTCPISAATCPSSQWDWSTWWAGSKDLWYPRATPKR